MELSAHIKDIAAMSVFVKSLRQQLKEFTKGLTALCTENADLNAGLSRLEKRVKDLIETNSQWECYDKDREEYMHQLLKERPCLSNDQQHEIDRIIEGYKHKVTVVEKEKANIENENCALRKEIQLNKQAIAALHQQLNLQPVVDSQQHLDKIQVLEAQIDICTNNLFHERKDRENAQSRITELEKEIDLTKRQLEQFQVSHMTRLHNQRTAALARYKSEYASRCHGSSVEVEDCDTDADLVEFP